MGFPLEGNLLTGKVCLVTGVSRGIGRATAELFLQKGATVYGVARDVSELMGSDSFIPLSLDVKDTEAMRFLIRKIKKEQIQLNCLVNNAAMEENDTLGSITHQFMQDMFETNVFAVIDLIQLCARLMRKKGGSIINVTSRVGERGNAGQTVYSATKGAVIALTKSVSQELAPLGIRVNAVSPGLTDTQMFRKTPPEKTNKRLGSIPLGRVATPEEIANAILFLACDNASYLTGHVLNVDGGALM